MGSNQEVGNFTVPAHQPQRGTTLPGGPARVWSDCYAPALDPPLSWNVCVKSTPNA